jgi:hypothetical protein
MQDQSLEKLIHYVYTESFKGYDPYDALLSWIPFKYLGKYLQIAAIQTQKRNPVNIRPLLGIKKEINPKAMGIFLKAFSILYKKTGNGYYLNLADSIYNWLITNYTKGYSGICWGYNFPWVSNSKSLQAFYPSSVVTGIICKGIWEYYQITKKKDTVCTLFSALNFIENDLHEFKDNSGLSLSYTPVQLDICYNASLLSGEVIAMNYFLTQKTELKKKCVDIVNFVISRQKDNGMWYYAQDLNSLKEDKQVDFHQGYILESIYSIKNLLDYKNNNWENSIKKGLEFYFKYQFLHTGQSIWRYPKKMPVEIHNQSQGIITFYVLREYGPDYLDFSEKIAKWTTENMQSSDGYFFYRRNKYFINKISYMRWSQSWMLLALSYLIK